MNFAPKEQGAVIPDLKNYLPTTIDEAIAYLNSKFRLVLDSDQMYEEYIDSKDGETPLRAVHQTFAMGAKIESQDTVKNLIAGWFICLMDSALASKRERLYWRMKPKISVEWTEFPDGPAYALQIISRSSMI